jgi:hypothetical protein
VARVAADAIQEGQYMAYQRMQHRGAEPEFEREPAAAAAAVEIGSEEADARRVMLSAEEAAWMGIGVEGGATAPGSAPVPDAEQVAPSESDTPAAAVAETATVPAEPVAAEVSSSWAAPAGGRPEEARTVPDVEGPADSPEEVEAQVDGVAEPATEIEGEPGAEAAAAPDESPDDERVVASPASGSATSVPAGE